MEADVASGAVMQARETVIPLFLMRMSPIDSDLARDLLRFWRSA